MNRAEIHNTGDRANIAVSSRRTFPAPPFPRQHIHAVIDALEPAVRAVQELHQAGYEAEEVHLMASWDFVEATERREQSDGRARPLTDFFSSLDGGFGDLYLREARRGSHIIAVRLANDGQIEPIRDILARHGARLGKYLGTWTSADLL